MPFQKDISGNELYYGQTHQPKNFKLEGRQRKKLDLPAKKNLLTNYFCIASLEAKQNFRVPRIAPIDSNADGSSTALLDRQMEADSSELRSSSVHLEENNVNILVDGTTAIRDCHLESTGDGRHEKKGSRDGQGMQRTLFQHSICKPCVLLHKDRVSKNKTVMENGKVVVRSSYFLPRKIGKENIQENGTELGESATEKSNTISSAEECPSASEVIEEEMNTVCPKTTLSFKLQHSSADENDESETKPESKRGIIRSAYFQHQSSLNRNSPIEEHGDPLPEEDAISSEIDERKMPENPFHYYKPKLGKRKVTFSNTIENDTVKASRRIFTDSSPNGQSKSNPQDEDNVSANEVNVEDEKFGSNLSHLGNYCQISKKSMERFVSVISSFAFTSNGSRASGLRAPLKDIKNASRNGAPREMDLDRFVYLPSPNRGRHSARRRI
ncbi:unnamed protein product [Cuscuta campestris]|uniref:Uncharacterized protein n=1 Tax=Cuscuta campestris TaxID=132261 RepID=A0A484MI33_9ASTE|nr:unnamed protein product [Cuscuta campestris]